MKKREKEIGKKFADPTMVTSQTVLTQDEFLTNVVKGVRDNRFALGEILPDEEVRKDTDKIQVVNPAGHFKPASRREETALPEQSAVQFDEDTYSCDEFALEGWVSDKARKNAIASLDPLARQATYLAKKIMLTEEIAKISEIFSAIKSAGANYFDILGAAAKWNGGASSTPLDDISSAMIAIQKRTGVDANTITMQRASYEAFVNNDQVKNVLKYNQSGNVEALNPVDSIRGLRLVMANAVVNSGTTDSPTYVNILYDVSTTTQFYDAVLLSYVDPNDPLTFGYNMVSDPFFSAQLRGNEGARRKATLVYVSKEFGPKIINVGAGHIIAKVLG